MYRNTTDILHWFLCPAICLLVLTGFIIWYLWGFLYIKSCHLWTEILLLSFQFRCLLFIFLAKLLWIGLPILYWIEVARRDILALSLILQEKLSVLTILYKFSCGLFIYSLYYVEVISFPSQFTKCFYLKSVLNIVKCLFSISWDNHVVFVLYSVSVVYHIDWFLHVVISLHSGDKSHLATLITLLTYCWIQFASIVLRIFFINIHEGC